MQHGNRAPTTKKDRLPPSLWWNPCPVSGVVPLASPSSSSDGSAASRATLGRPGLNSMRAQPCQHPLDHPQPAAGSTRVAREGTWLRDDRCVDPYRVAHENAERPRMPARPQQPHGRELPLTPQTRLQRTGYGAAPVHLRRRPRGRCCCCRRNAHVRRVACTRTAG